MTSSYVLEAARRASESRSAAPSLEEGMTALKAIETLETIRYVCKNCMGGAGIKTIDELAAYAISLLQAEGGSK